MSKHRRDEKEAAVCDEGPLKKKRGEHASAFTEPEIDLDSLHPEEFEEYLNKHKKSVPFVEYFMHEKNKSGEDVKMPTLFKRDDMFVHKWEIPNLPDLVTYKEIESKTAADVVRWKDAYWTSDVRRLSNLKPWFIDVVNYALSGGKNDVKIDPIGDLIYQMVNPVRLHAQYREAYRPPNDASRNFGESHVLWMDTSEVMLAIAAIFENPPSKHNFSLEDGDEWFSENMTANSEWTIVNQTPKLCHIGYSLARTMKPRHLLFSFNDLSIEIAFSAVVPSQTGLDVEELFLREWLEYLSCDWGSCMTICKLSEKHKEL